MYPDALAPATAHGLATLKQLPEIHDLYLGGGTAVALHLGHRLSVDLDFFSGLPIDTLALRQHLSQLGAFQLEAESRGTLHGVLDGAKVTFLEYHYPLLDPGDTYAGITIGSVRDLACMKLDTIASRGKKRDFIDLYAILQTGIRLEEVLQWFARKYARIAYNQLHLLKSLTYFEDAEADPMPTMLKEMHWNDVKAFFTQESPRCISFLGT